MRFDEWWSKNNHGRKWRWYKRTNAKKGWNAALDTVARSLRASGETELAKVFEKLKEQDA